MVQSKQILTIWANACVSPLTYYFLFRTSPFYIRTYPSHILPFRLRRPCLIPVTTLYSHTTVLFINLLCAPLISVSLLAPTVSAGFQPAAIRTFRAEILKFYPYI